MRKYILFLFGFSLLYAEPISIEQALLYAAANNPKIQVDKASLEQSESERAAARSRFLPEIAVSGRVTRIDNPISIDLNPIRSAIIGVHGAEAYSNYLQQSNSELVAMGAKVQTEKALDAALPDFSTKVQDKLFFNARASLVWPVFTGGRIWNAYQASKDNVDARKSEYAYKENQALSEIALRYFGLRLAEDLVSLKEKTHENLKSHFETALKLEQAGQVSRAERLRAEVALSEAEYELENAGSDLSLSRLALSKSLQRDASLEAITPIEIPNMFLSFEKYKIKVLEKSPVLNQIRQEKKRSNRGVSAARGEFLPTVALFGYKELYTKDLTILEPNWAVGVDLNWILFKGGETASKVSSAKSVGRTLSYMETQATEDIGLLVEKYFREFESAKRRVESLKKTKELAEESLRSQKLAFEAGLTTSLSVVDAELALTRLEVGNLKAKYDAMMAFVRILEIGGEVSQLGEFLEKKK